MLRTAEPGRALEVLRGAGATATAVDHDTLQVTGLEAQRIVAALGEQQVPFFEVAAQRASLEGVYLRLTGGEVDYRAGADQGGAR